jgi:hypothetical protein
MKTVQAIKFPGKPFEFKTTEELKNPLVLVFGNRYQLEAPSIYTEVHSLFPDGHIVFGTTSGEILGEEVHENTIVLTAIDFEKSTFKVRTKNISEFKNDGFNLGEALVGEFPKEGLKYLFLVSEGSFINGSALINGIEKGKDSQIGLSGGLCGDDDRFERTMASYNENPKNGEVVAIGFYGEDLEITSANFGGWTAFGPERIITKSTGNILYELDGKPALDLYRKYLGDKAKELPKSALLYPLSVRSSREKEPIVRTILNIDEDTNAMILAGDVPIGSYVQLMMSTVDYLANGAKTAAELATNKRKVKPELAVLVSCVGRKLVMDQRIEEELEEVKNIIGDKVAVCGFYSYGEMAPFANQEHCMLHNQTMTLTLFSE